MSIIPNIHEYPFCVEVTDLNTNQTTLHFYTNQQSAVDHVKSVVEDDFFAVGWDRLNQNPIETTHKSLEPITFETAELLPIPVV